MVDIKDPDFHEKNEGDDKKKSSSGSSHAGGSWSPKEKETEPAIAGDIEVDGMLNKLHQMDEDLQERMNRICVLSGMTKNELENYIGNPHNFTDTEWSRVQKEKQVLEDKVFQTIGIQAKQTVVKKKKKKLEKGRKGKTLGSRKGWIQM